MESEKNHQELKNQNESLANSIKSKIKQAPSSRSCIYRVPKKLKSIKEKAYVPELISIGPFHKHKSDLQFMEDHKHWYLQSLLSRSSTINNTNSNSTDLVDLVSSIRGLETEARESYVELDDLEDKGISSSSDDFVEMMVLDACFILELLWRNHNESLRSENDLIFGSAWMLSSLKRDLILLENQIPFIVLETIFGLTCYRDLEKGGPSLDDLLMCFFNSMLPEVERDRNPSNQSSTQNHKPKPKPKPKHPSNQSSTQNPKPKPKHMLDFIREIMIPTKSKNEDAGRYPIWENTHCVTDLCEAGVTFRKKKKDPDGLLDIQFSSKDGILEIPPFFFDDSTDVLLRNLVAMEQCDGNSTPLITSYVFLLNILINSGKDVRLLCDKRIVHSYLRDDEEMAKVIGNLCEGVTITTFYYDGLCSRCNEYYKTLLNKWKANLRRDYFGTPWTVLSLSGAVILLVLTFLQTLFTIRKP